MVGISGGDISVGVIQIKAKVFDHPPMAVWKFSDCVNLIVALVA